MVSLPDSLSSVTPSALLGEIVTWDLSAMEVPFTRVMAALDDAGLPKGAAVELRAVTAFGRAVRDFKTNRSIDRVKEEGKDSPIIRFQFTRKELEDSGLRIDFSYETTVTLDTSTGEITCPQAQIEDHAREMFAHAQAHRTTSDITRLVQTMFTRHAELYPINPKKGVAYFVPEAHRDFSARMEMFLTALGGKLLRFPVPTGTPGPCPVCDRFTKHLFCSQDCARRYLEIKKARA